MQFKKINKETYRKRYKTVSYILVATLITLALSLSTLFVTLWGEPNSGENFWLNLSGVALAAFLVAGVLQLFKEHAYLYELKYVWDLKKALNRINRKRNAIRTAAEKGDSNALLILQYYYDGCEQLWTLDDNTLIIPELNEWKKELEQWLTQYNIQVDLSDYHQELLQHYK